MGKYIETKEFFYNSIISIGNRLEDIIFYPFNLYVRKKFDKKCEESGVSGNFKKKWKSHIDYGSWIYPSDDCNTFIPHSILSKMRLGEISQEFEKIIQEMQQYSENK